MYYLKKCHKKCRSPFLQENLFLGCEAQQKAVLTKNVSHVQVFSIAISCPRLVGKLLFLAMTNFSAVNFSLKSLNIKRIRAMLNQRDKKHRSFCLLSSK